MKGMPSSIAAFQAAALAGRSQISDMVMYGAGEKRLTPLEIDAELQISELMYRNLLEGKAVQMDQRSDMDAWFKEQFGEDWASRNKLQRMEVQRQAKENGENTPLWTEALLNATDLGWEVIEGGKRGGEKIRQLEAVDRSEVLVHLQQLLTKVRISHYARCGAGERLMGQRACVAVFYVFVRDPEVLSLCAQCLRLMIDGHEWNRDGLAALTQPLPPQERSKAADRGWTFLRVALDAFATQAGVESVKRPELEQDESEWEKVKPSDAEPPKPDPEAAMKIAECIVAAKGAPALEAQLKLLNEDLPSDACQERRDLKDLLPVAVRCAKELQKQQKGCEVLTALLELLQSES